MSISQGWINLYKPANISSFKAINKIKNKFNFSKLGHAGTLDPMASGVLPVAIGKTTKLIKYITNDYKKYKFVIEWGAQTSTDDSSGIVLKKSKIFPSEREIISAIGDFVGSILQCPPKVSAIKINGQRAYKLFRKNSEFETSPKKVYVKNLRFLSAENKFATFEIECGKGFYVRSFARDFAIKLGTYGHITKLERLNVANFHSKSSILLDDFLKISNRHELISCIYPSVSMLDDILAYEIENKEDLKKISLGKSIIIEKKNLIFPQKAIEENEIFLSQDGDVISVGKLVGNLFKPKKVLI